MSVQTLVDIAALNNSDDVVGLIEENLSFAPEARIIPFRSIKGTSYHTRKRTGIPTVGFRGANEGFTPSKSTFERVLQQCFIFGGRIEFDKAVAQAYEGGMSEFEMIEASGVMRAALAAFGTQLYYGVSADAKGFGGLKAFTPKGGALTVDATGSTATTASSVYFVRTGLQDIIGIMGNDAKMELDPFRDETIVDPVTSTKKLPGRVSDLSSWIGLQIGNDNCVGRICNLTEDSGKGMTDSLTATLLAKFPVGYAPNACFMSRRSLAQLQKSRVATTIAALSGNRRSPDGMDFMAPTPTETQGVPIFVTDSILNTDAIE